jgi:hypothetical protein
VDVFSAIRNSSSDYAARSFHEKAGECHVFFLPLNIRLFVPEAYDPVLSKLARNESRDREDVAYLVKSQRLDPVVLKKRYEEELRPIIIGEPTWHDGTFKFWLDAHFAT